MDIRQIADWLKRLANLDARVFDEVRNNPAATIAGVAIVLGATLLAGLGGWFWWMVKGFGNNGDVFLHSVLLGSLISVVIWCFGWVLVVYVVLTQFFRERAYLEQLLRVMGVATAPLALMLLMFVPGVSLGVGLLSLMLTFGLTNIAIQSATTAQPPRILAANAIGFFIWASALSLLAQSNLPDVTPHAPGVFLYNTTAGFAEEFLNLSDVLQGLSQ